MSFSTTAQLERELFKNGTIFFQLPWFSGRGVHGDVVVGQIPLLPASSSAHRAPLPPFQIEVWVNEFFASCQPRVERAEPTTCRCFVHLAMNKTGSPPHLRLSRALEKNSQEQVGSGNCPAKNTSLSS